MVYKLLEWPWVYHLGVNHFMQKSLAPTPSWQNREGLAPQSGQTPINGGQVPTVPLRDGNWAGWVRRMGSSCPPYMVLSYPIFALPYLAWWEKFSCPISAPWGPAPLHNTLLLTNLLTIITVVFNKTYFFNKNNLKLQINLSHQIKLIFSKN